MYPYIALFKNLPTKHLGHGFSIAPYNVNPMYLDLRFTHKESKITELMSYISLPGMGQRMGLVRLEPTFMRIEPLGKIIAYHKAVRKLLVFLKTATDVGEPMVMKIDMSYDIKPKYIHLKEFGFKNLRTIISYGHSNGYIVDFGKNGEIINEQYTDDISFPKELKELI